jgi:hypothetical protein
VTIANGVHTDHQKITTMQSWLEPKTLKELRDFLSLICYYRKFIKGYGVLSKPLTNLLKKMDFYGVGKLALPFIH